MERLTEKRDGKNVIPLRNMVCGVDLPYWKISRANELVSFLYGDAADRLATYEDAGLEPEEISNIIKGCIGIYRQDWMVTLFGKPLSEWYEIAKAEEQGLLIRLPCKVGACAYYINPFDEIEKGKITMIQQKADGTWKFRFSTSFSHDVTKDDLGKTVFFTREEAEKALEGMK